MTSPVTNSNERMPDAVILAGGKGTRLRSVVSDRPKPMAEVEGRPFLELLVEDLRRQGVRRIILSIGYMSDAIQKNFDNRSDLGIEIICVPESMPLGTGGAVANVLDEVTTERFFVLNGDSFCSPNLRDLEQAHIHAKAQATIHAVAMDDCRRYGSISVNEDGSVIRFEEKSTTAKAGLINSGVYVLEKSLIASCPINAPYSLEKDVFPELTDGRLHSLVGDGPFIDIGLPETYAQAPDFFRSLRAES